MAILKFLVLVLAWVLFYHILKSRNKRLPKLKATIITLLFASLFIGLSTNIYTKLETALSPSTVQEKQQKHEPEAKISH